ncbi:hypothetical protein P692DRAFT_20563223 [Suillus brevipes Sb2]|nr:hypothetical protein P692DRAFT_20563223 [Suillus brevipes Sb2]
MQLFNDFRVPTHIRWLVGHEMKPQLKYSSLHIRGSLSLPQTESHTESLVLAGMQDHSAKLHVLLRVPVHRRTQRPMLAPRLQHRQPYPYFRALTTLEERSSSAHAWFNFNASSPKTVTLPVIPRPPKYVSGEHLYLWNPDDNLVNISLIPFKLPQRTVERDWSPRRLCPSP